MKGNDYGWLFRFIREVIRIIYPKYTVKLPTNINRPVVYISHHQNLFGPFVTMLWFPKCLHPWVLHVLLDRVACYKHYVDYTFTERFGMNKLLAKTFAFPLSNVITKFLNSARGIPVYRGTRKILQTFNLSISLLCKGESIVIFPDIDYSDTSSRTKDMYDGFLYLEKYYYKATGNHVGFVPLYASKNKKMILAETEICFRDGKDFNTERKIVYKRIQDSLNYLAEKCGDY